MVSGGNCPEGDTAVPGVSNMSSGENSEGEAALAPWCPKIHPRNKRSKKNARRISLENTQALHLFGKHCENKTERGMCAFANRSMGKNTEAGTGR